MNSLKIKITTKSNCLIGNQTQSFSVGGVDQATTIDEEGYPMIPGSAVKGVLRVVACDYDESAQHIKKFYEKKLYEIVKKYEEFENDFLKKDAIEELKKDVKEYLKEVKAEYIFGIEGINDMPKIYVSDFKVESGREKNINKYFLIDSKTSITENTDNKLQSNPRTYKVVKPEISFIGKLYLKGFHKEEEEQVENIKEEIEFLLKKFNEDLYFIGNSKSRGYGRIRVKVIEDTGESL